MPFKNVTISKHMQAHLSPIKSQVFGNPYNDLHFYVRNVPRKPNSLIFVGRLEPVKGPDLLFQAVQELFDEGSGFSLTIIGGGELLSELKQQAAQVVGGMQVSVLGPRTSIEVAEELNRHEVAVIPSVWEEPFGLVALEALACGCKLVVTSNGGLFEAAGGHAETCLNGDVGTLKTAILRAARRTTGADEKEAIRLYLEGRTHSAFAIRYERALVELLGDAKQVW